MLYSILLDISNKKNYKKYQKAYIKGQKYITLFTITSS